MDDKERRSILKERLELYTTIPEKIERRRRQILVHSILYYEFNENLVSDYQWSQWAMELVELQNKYPKWSELAPLYEEFKNFDGSTGYDLPLRDPHFMSIALRLRQYHTAHYA